ncbi:MAG: long-chain fatty acid--CoA ligase [Desulfobacteraceae bacterium]|nr:long-chain fatty acid--CoA ligase [Desulfobacteraceae bacterium]MBU4001396.1 long-chain-fatty-acid--CoA ligase [Pseudomonadota bacterium]
METRTYPEFSTDYPLLLTTIMKRPVNIYPDRIGVIYRNPETAQYFRFTWKQWYERTCRLANALKTLGVKPGTPDEPGDRVATMAMSHHYHLELYFAVPCSGAVLHPVNTRLSLDHIVHTINHAGDKILFFDDSLLSMVESIYDRIKGTVEKFVYISDVSGKPDSKIQNLYVYEDLLVHASPNMEWPYLNEKTIATLCYTTGTTGLPKGAMFSHRALYLLCVHQMLKDFMSNDPAYIHMGETGVILLNTPLYHIHGWGIPFRTIFSSQTLVLPGTFTVDGFCDLVQTEKVTNTSVVPTVLTMIVEYEHLDRYDLTSLKNILVGGGALSLGLKKKAEAKIPGFTANSGYGMTETAPSTIASFVKSYMKNWPNEELDKIRVKTGLPYPGLEVEVFDADGKPVPRDNTAIGEIVIRGPWVMKEYYKDPEKTRDVWYDGWFHTGDVAKVDEEGYVTLADRVKDMIRSGAEMVPTVLLENLTAMADFVLEATYVGVPDDKWGERPMAIVTLIPGAGETEEDVLNFLQKEGVEKGKITKWMLPSYILISSSIPKTSVGKFDKLTIKKGIQDFASNAKKF